MKRLLILSGKGGTGKTTTAAAFLACSGARAFADCDVDAPNLHIVAQMEGQPRQSEFYGGCKAVLDTERCNACGLCLAHCRFEAVRTAGKTLCIDEYACEGCGVCARLCPTGAITLRQDVAGCKELYLQQRVFSTATLKMGRGNSGKLVSEVKLALIKNAPDTELAIFDGAPGIGCPVMASVGGMDLVLLVAEPSLSGISDLRRLLKTLESFEVAVAVCINKWDVSPHHSQSIEALCASEGVAFVGKIPYDPTAFRAINDGQSPVAQPCPSGAALRSIYENTMKLIFKIEKEN